MLCAPGSFPPVQRLPWRPGALSEAPSAKAEQPVSLLPEEPFSSAPFPTSGQELLLPGSLASRCPVSGSPRHSPERHWGLRPTSKQPGLWAVGLLCTRHSGPCSLYTASSLAVTLWDTLSHTSLGEARVLPLPLPSTLQHVAGTRYHHALAGQPERLPIRARPQASARLALALSHVFTAGSPPVSR